MCVIFAKYIILLGIFQRKKTPNSKHASNRYAEL